MRNRQQEIASIKQKGFNIASRNSELVQEDYQHIMTDFGKIKVGAKQLEDAVMDFGNFARLDRRLGDKKKVLEAIHNYDLATMREISNFFYKTSNIYARILRYMAFLYRYDWYLTPYIDDLENDKIVSKALTSFHSALADLDNFGVKKQFGEIALKVLLNGVYYGYIVEGNNAISLQELPPNYCRCRYHLDNKPVVEFNMKFFDSFFKTIEQRMQALKLFPDEFSKGYVLYKQGKLPPQFNGDEEGWYTLTVGSAVRFTANNEEYPMFIAVIPHIIDLDVSQDMDMKKTAQRLAKILIQKMPLDKNNELVFDVDEAQQLHNNAVQMLSRAIGVDVLTTFADVSVESLSDTSTAAAQTDDLDRTAQQVYGEAGISYQQFNSDNSVAIEKSIKNDEATMYNLILQFEKFLNILIEKYNKSPKKFFFRVQILTTTIYNYETLSKLYKEQMQVGFSKMLPQIALGQSQSSILANAYFENDVLDLINVFVPPLMSSTMNAEALSSVTGKDAAADAEAGRPTNEEAGKPTTEKTIANRESQGNG